LRFLRLTPYETAFFKVAVPKSDILELPHLYSKKVGEWGVKRYCGDHDILKGFAGKLPELCEEPPLPPI
jgi:hypothetical protein